MIRCPNARRYRVVDRIPLENLTALVMAISVLFNLMSIANRFRLWRLDANRVTLEEQVRELLGTAISRKETDLIDPTEILDSAQEGFPYLWVNGEKYVFS